MSRLAEVAEQEAKKDFHGKILGKEPNIHEMVARFPKWSVEEADGLWCAAFVLHCCTKAGMQIPPRPAECTLSLAACPAWEEWAKADPRITYVSGSAEPQAGDIVVFYHVFCQSPHDHMGIVIGVTGDTLFVAEGNYQNTSCIVQRKRDAHIRCYITIPEGFRYEP